MPPTGSKLKRLIFSHRYPVHGNSYPTHSRHPPYSRLTLRFTVLFVYGASRFDGRMAVIDGRWFTDNPWLCSHTARRVTLAPSHYVLDSSLHVALDTLTDPHTPPSLSLRSSPLPPSYLSFFILKPILPTVSLCAHLIFFYFYYCWPPKTWFHFEPNVIFSGGSCNYIFWCRISLPSQHVEKTISLNLFEHNWASVLTCHIAIVKIQLKKITVEFILLALKMKHC